MNQKTREPSILVVDDEVELCDVVQFYLQDAHYKVVQAHGGDAALDLIDQQAFDAIVTDVLMPKGSGFDLLQGLSLRGLRIPVLMMMTAYSDLPVDMAFDLGVAALLAKPVREDLLLSALAAVMAAPQERWARRFERVKADCQIALTVPPASIKDAALVNLGRGGAFVALPSDNLLATGQTASFRLDMPQDWSLPVVDGQAVVRWVRPAATEYGPAGVGIEFLELTEQSRAAVAILTNELKIQSFAAR